MEGLNDAVGTRRRLRRRVRISEGANEAGGEDISPGRPGAPAPVLGREIGIDPTLSGFGSYTELLMIKTEIGNVPFEVSVPFVRTPVGLSCICS